MRALSIRQEAWLREHFPDRASTDLMERRIYSHDVGEMPPLIRPLVGKGLADAVVQPQNEAEIVELVRWAAENGIPLVPRAKATSGYGGVLPVKGGVTVNFWRMRRLLSLDPDALTVTAEPGIVWQDLEQELAKEGLALRLYPSSAPSSTVGGWLAQGGFGYGSFEYGSFADNVVSARVVLPNSEVRTFRNELDLVADAEGITGIITEITLKVRPLEDEAIVGTRFSDVQQLTAAMEGIVGSALPLWSISFINPTMARLKNQLPPRLEHGHPVDEEKLEIPEAYIALFVFPTSRTAQVVPDLERIVAVHDGTRLPDGLARREWEERFKIMHVKRLGPSLIPTELVLPLGNLGPALTGIQDSIRQPFVVEGVIAGGKSHQAVLLGFIPHDRRTLGYNLAFGLSLSAIEKAKRYGGRAYASGLYFARETENILGTSRTRRLRAFKADVDPHGIMNPGKVLSNGALGTFMGVATAFEPLIRVAGNLAKVPLSERIAGAGERGVPDDVAWYAHACAQCGYCVSECDQFYGRGWESESPRAKWFFLREYMAGRANLDQQWVDRFLACTTCELCNVKCPLELPNEPSWLEMRGIAVHDQDKSTLPAFEIMQAALRKERDIWVGYSRDRAQWLPDDLKAKIKERASTAYFGGCTASFVEHDVAQGTARLLDAAGIEFTYMGTEEACCGIPMLVAGLWDTYEEILRHNVEGMKKRGVETIVTSCPACWLSWAVYYPQWAARLGIEYPFQAKHYSQLIAGRIESGDLAFIHPVDMKVTWHDSCHMGRAGGIYEPPRQVLQAIPGLELVEMEHNREHGHCCGGVITLVENPDTAQVVGDVRVREAEATGAEAIVASCPCCEVQLRVTMQKTGRDLPVIDLSHIAAQGLGIDLPDPTSYALEQWSTFEAMIWLLKPQAMADMMVELFPQMVDAMPMGMGKVMRAIGRMGPAGAAMLGALKPFFPSLFPILMPAVMPKVLPAMLAAVEKRVPMPQYMKEQMPDLMPQAMDRLIPKMLPSIVPLISDPLVAYLCRAPTEKS
jgi:Fe-S oxidoreductase/FAD/FMN-containing dehydrogenase